MFVRNRPLARFICFFNDEGAAAGAPAAPDAGAPPPADPPAVEEYDFESELTQDVFDRPYVEKLRGSGARYRTERNELQSRLDSIYDGIEDPSDLDYVAGIVRKLYAGNGVEAVTEFEGMLTRLRESLGIESGHAPTPEEGDPNDPDRPLTRADLERIERERAAAHAVAQLQKEATSLGYQDGTPEYAQLIWIANNDKAAERDLQKAHGLILSRIDALKQAAVQEYIESVRAGNAEFPALSAPSGGLGGSPDASAPKTFKDASASALERLEKML